MKKTLQAALVWVLLAGAAILFPLSSAHATETFAAETEMRQYTASAGVEGYILFNGVSDPLTYKASPKGVAYLVDRQGYKYKTWYNVSFSPRLLEDGKLWSVGKVQDWNGNLVWIYDNPPAGYNIHHEGQRIWNKKLSQYTYLMLYNYTADSTALIAAGYGSATGSIQKLDGIIEVNQNKEIIWQWRFLDHVIQSSNAAWANYETDTSSAAWTGRCNLFFKSFHQIMNGGTGIEDNWHNATSIDYNDTLGHIVINSRKWGEVYVINHDGTFTDGSNWATNINNAKGVGGNFLYRFGNAGAYNAAGFTTATFPGYRADGRYQLFYPDQATWLQKEWNDPHAGDSWTAGAALPIVGAGTNHLLVFNSNKGRYTMQSRVMEINPGWDGSAAYTSETAAGYATGTYAQSSNQVTYTYQGGGQWFFYEDDYSAVQRMTNTGLFISHGGHGALQQAASGSSTNAVWEYIVPVMRTDTLPPSIVSYRTDWMDGDNRSPVRARFYGTTFPAFVSNALTQGATITGNPLRAIGAADMGFSCGSVSSDCAQCSTSGGGSCPTCYTCGSGCTTCTPNSTCSAVCPNSVCFNNTCCGSSCEPNTSCTNCDDFCGSCCGTECTTHACTSACPDAGCGVGVPCCDTGGTTCWPAATTCTPLGSDCCGTQTCDPSALSSCATCLPQTACGTGCLTCPDLGCHTCLPDTACGSGCSTCPELGCHTCLPSSVCNSGCGPCTANTSCPACTPSSACGVHGCCDGVASCYPPASGCATCPEPCYEQCNDAACAAIWGAHGCKNCYDGCECWGESACCKLIFPLKDVPTVQVLGAWSAGKCVQCPCGTVDDEKSKYDRGWGSDNRAAGGGAGGAGGGGGGGY